MSRGPGRVQRYIRGHLAALKGDWCPAPDLAAAYAIAVGIPLELRRGRRVCQRAIPYAPRSVESAVYRAVTSMPGIEWSRNSYGLFMDSAYIEYPPWLYCYRDASFLTRPEWPPLRGAEWREQCRTPVSVAAVDVTNSRNTYARDGAR
jgi:hypothetical protein